MIRYLVDNVKSTKAREMVYESHWNKAGKKVRI
jgi:hypothetical protein